MAEEHRAVSGVEPVRETEALHRVECDRVGGEATATTRADQRAELGWPLADGLRVEPSRVRAHEKLVAAFAGFGDRKPFRLGEERTNRARLGHGITIVAVPGQVPRPGELQGAGAPLLESRDDELSPNLSRSGI